MVRPPFGAVLVLTFVAAIAALGEPASTLEQHWVAAPPHADYIESIDLHEDGRVDAVFGYGQLVRCDYHGRWKRAGGDFLSFEYELEDGRREVRTVDFGIDEGDFKVIDHDSGTVRHFGCRIWFDESPFPSHCETQRVYFSCPR